MSVCHKIIVIVSDGKITFFSPLKLISILWEEALRLCKYLVLIQLSPSGFSINGCSLPELIITIMIDKWQFSNSIAPFQLNRWPSTLRKNFVFFPCIYSFVHFHQCKLIDSYSTQWNVICYHHYLF